MLTAVAGAVSGIAVWLVLHGVQFVIYCTTETAEHPSLDDTSPLARFLALTVTGIVVAVGWWAIRTYARPVVSVAKAVAGERMPWFATSIHVLLQLVSVGAGASIGREVAPREWGAAWGGQISDWFRLDEKDRRILVACGAAAGLSAVYDIPIAGTIFALEVLLVELRAVTVIAAIVTCAGAAYLAQVVIPRGPLYVQRAAHATDATLPAAIVLALVLGLLGTGFARVTEWFEKHRPKGKNQLWTIPLAYTAVGAIGAFLPEVLGNGRAAAHVGFHGAPVLILLLIGLAKMLTTGGTLASGAAGGTLTPSVAIGSTLGAAGGWALGLVLPGLDPLACALIGATAFLTATMAAPLTALALVIEFTGSGYPMFAPLLVAAGVAILTTRVGVLRKRGRAGHFLAEGGLPD